MNKESHLTRAEEFTNLIKCDVANGQRSPKRPTVIIFAPPWPRSGTARVIQNQITYYRERGYFTILVAVPFLQYLVYADPIELANGMGELGADRTHIATFDQKAFTAAKRKATVRHAFFGTVLDWHIAAGESAQLKQDDLDFLRTLPTVLFHVNHVYTLGFAINLRKSLFPDRSPIPIILETHDIQAHLLKERGDCNPLTGRPDSLERLIKSETKSLEKADVLIHLSTDDFGFFQKLMPSKPHFLALPTIDENFIHAANAAPVRVEPFDLLFVGRWHSPNLAALNWFFGYVWPRIEDRQYNVKIVGPVGSMVKQELPRLFDAFSSYFVGEVSSLVDYYQAARCVIAPMVSGSGISIKTIEALALGKPLVGTLKAFRGMPMDRLAEAGIQGHDEPQAFADAVVRTLCEQDRAQTASRAAYEKVFSAKASFVSRDQAVRAATIASEQP